MARLFKLISGSDEINLIDTADPGIIFRRGGAGPNRVNAQLALTSSQLADGANLRLKRTLPVAETYRLNLKGSNHDNVASQLQALQRILRKGDLNALTTWQQEPLYIQQQTTNETNTRYAKVLAWNGQEISDFFGPPIESDSQIDDFAIRLVREPFWRSAAPGSMPSAEAILHPDFPWFDEYTGTRANFDVTAAAALEGDWGAEFTLVGAGSEIFGIDNRPSGETEFTLEFLLDPNSLPMSNGDQFEMTIPTSDGAGSFPWRLRLKMSGTDYQLIITSLKDDGLGVVPNIEQTIIDGSQLVRIEWKASTGPGNDDGFTKLYIADVLVGSTTGIDNDTHNVTDLKIGAVSGIDAGTTGGSFYLDRIRWDNAIPVVAYERTIDFEQTTIPIPNFRQSTGVLSHIFMEDNGTGFSANFVAAPNFPLFEVSGSTPAANDAMYFGSDEPFFNVAFNLQAGDVDVVTTVEFSDGVGGWTVVGVGALNVLNFLYIESYAGQVVLQFGGDPLWAADTVNGVGSKFWLRIKLTTVTTWTTSPEQIDQIVYTVNSPYIEFNTLQVHGDAPALMLQRLICFSNTNNNSADDPESSTITNAIMGMKSRGLDTFVSRLNCGGDNPANWTETLGSNTSQVAKETSPGGNVAKVTWADNTEMKLRVRFNLDIDSQDPNDFEGKYRIYCRARQNGGAVGDVKLRYRLVVTSPEFIGETMTMVDTDMDEIVDLGDLSIFTSGLLGDETPGAASFRFSIEASSESTGVTSLELYDLVMMPSDEMFIHSAWSGKTNQELQGTITLQMDAGILREGAVLQHRPVQPVEEFQPFFTWQMKSALPMLEPRRQSRLYYLYWQDRQVTGTNISNQGQLVSGRTFLHERWNTLRGSD